MLNNMNADNFSATPVGLSSPFPTCSWTSNTYDILRIFSFPSGNQGQYTFSTSSKNSKVTFNHILNSRTRDRKISFRTQEILQFYMLVSEAFLWAKCTTQEVKLHLSHKNLIKCPITQQNRWRFYGSYASTRQVNFSTFKIGTLWSDNASKDFAQLRLRFNKGKFNDEYYLYGKGGCTLNSVWNIGALVVLDLKNHQLQKNDVKVGWEINDNHWLSLQLQTKGFRTAKIQKLQDVFDIMRMNYFYRFDNSRWTGGIRHEHNIENLKFKKTEVLIDFTSAGKGLSNFKSKFVFSPEPKSNQSTKKDLKVKVVGQLAATYSHSSTLKAEVGLRFDKLDSFNFKPNAFGANIVIGEM